MSVCLSVRLSVCVSVCLSVCQSVCLSDWLSVCLSVCLCCRWYIHSRRDGGFHWAGCRSARLPVNEVPTQSFKQDRQVIDSCIQLKSYSWSIVSLILTYSTFSAPLVGPVGRSPPKCETRCLEQTPVLWQFRRKCVPNIQTDKQNRQTNRQTSSKLNIFHYHV